MIEDYVKKNAAVKAFQWNQRVTEPELKNFFENPSDYNITTSFSGTAIRLYVNTVEGMVPVRWQDYVVKNRDGVYTVVDRDIFGIIYEKSAKEKNPEPKKPDDRGLLEKLFSVFDDINFARRSVVCETEIDASVLAGVSMIFDKMKRLIETEGCEIILPEAGDAFDVNLHEAVNFSTIPEYDHNQITNVFQCGWKRDGKILKHAKVVVNR
jgi:Molecular chaperone GrpE (heat shock protein)